MTKSEGILDLQYAETMSNHPQGVALYLPPSTAILRSGIVGYFDDFGSWNVLLDLMDTEYLVNNGFTVPDGLVKAPVNSGIVWSPKTSGKVKEKKIDLSAGVDPVPGIPVTASVVYSYQTESDIGAVLVTDRPVTHERFYHSTPFKNWMKANAQIIIKRWREEVKCYGLWMITSTYSTRKCLINMWTKKGKGVNIGFSVDVMGAGHVGPSVEWHRSHADEGWAEYKAEGDNQCVVFFGGLRFNFSKSFPRRQASLKPAEGAGGRALRSPIEPSARGRAPFNEPAPEPEPESEYITHVEDPDDELKEIEIDCDTYGEEDITEGE